MHKPAQALVAARPGFTLIELMIALAITAVLGVMAVPNLSALVSRQRLAAAAQGLQADVAMARLVSARQGVAVFVRFQASPGWCYLVGTGPAGDCRLTGADPLHGVLKVVQGRDHPGIELPQALDLRIDAARPGNLIDGQGAGQAVFSSADGLQLRARLGLQGRLAVCSPGAPVIGHPACASEKPLLTP